MSDDTSPLSLRPSTTSTPLHDAIDHLGDSGDGFELGVKADGDGTVVEAEGTKTIGKGWSLSGAVGWMSSAGAAAWGKLKWTPGSTKSILLLIAGLTTIASCASAPLKPEPQLPSPEQLAALLAAPSPKNIRETIPATFTLAAPHVILEGNVFYVTCYVPESYGPGHIRVALEGIDASAHDIRGIETSLKVRPGCGTWVASCLVQTATGLVRELRQDVEVRGGMCDGTR